MWSGMRNRDAFAAPRFPVTLGGIGWTDNIDHSPHYGGHEADIEALVCRDSPGDWRESRPRHLLLE